MKTEPEKETVEKEAAKITNGCLLVGLGLLGSCVFLAAITGDSSTPSAEDKIKGFHCLSSWDGSHTEFKSMVKRQLNDPDSFEHIETRVTPDKNGEHIIFMEYSAKNGFGGRIKALALGTYSNETCNAVLTSVQ